MYIYTTDICPPFYWYPGVSSPDFAPVALLRLPGVPPHVRHYFKQMDHKDHVSLIAAAIPSPGGVWAEFGSGRGAFTLALAELIGSTGTIYSIDRDHNALRAQEHTFGSQLKGTQPALYFQAADFSKRLDLPALDGILMANALHFQREKNRVLSLILDYLHPGGRLILVEYNVDRGTPFVPHPLSYSTWAALADRAGFVETQLIRTRPSHFLGEIYSALSFKSS